MAMRRSLRVGMLGLITHGEDTGRYVVVIDDHDESGGYL